MPQFDMRQIQQGLAALITLVSLISAIRYATQNFR